MVSKIPMLNFGKKTHPAYNYNLKYVYNTDSDDRMYSGKRLKF